MTAAIRRATLDDLPALHCLVERSYRGEAARKGWSHEADLLEGQRTDPGELTDILTQPDRLMLAAEEDGRLIGCVQVSDRGEGVATLGMLSVEPKLQAAGLGRRLIEAAEDAAREAFHARRMRMTVIRQREPLIAWYERRGYRRTGGVEPFPMDDPRFGLPLRRDLEFAVLEKPL